MENGTTQRRQGYCIGCGEAIDLTGREGQRNGDGFLVGNDTIICRVCRYHHTRDSTIVLVPAQPLDQKA